MNIPLNKPFFGKEEAKMAALAIKSGKAAGDNQFGNLLKKVLQKKLKVKYALPTPSCTAALELAIMSLGIGPGDEVILPSFNFSSGAVAILRSGARPVFADIDKETFCVDPRSIGRAITSRTKAIMVVHYAGHACDMDAILKLAKKYNCKIIEDAAHAIGGKYKGRSLGTIGDIGCFSFHGTKNIVTGEGGAFVTNDRKIFEKAEIIREKGTNRPAFLRGEAPQYSLIDVGSSYLLADILSAVAIAQFKKLNDIIKLRKRHARYFLNNLADLAGIIRLPIVRSFADSDWHIFALLVEPKKRDTLLDFLKNSGIQASSHYLPLHSSVLGIKLGWNKRDLPNTDFVSRAIVRLPLYPSLSKKELDYIVKKIHEAARKIF